MDLYNGYRTHAKAMASQCPSPSHSMHRHVTTKARTMAKSMPMAKATAPTAVLWGFNTYSTRTNTYSTGKFDIIDPNQWPI